MKEANLAREILLAASKENHRLFMNTRGLAYRKDGTPVRYGLGPNGAGDLIGYARDGVFASIEVKTAKGVVREDQRQWARAAQAAGCRAGIARTVSEALAILDPSQ